MRNDDATHTRPRRRDRRPAPAAIIESVLISLKLIEIEAAGGTRTPDLRRAHTVATGDNPG